MNREDIQIGIPVWCSMGGYGWRPARVAKIGKKYIHVLFVSGKGGNGRRACDQIYPRDLHLNGIDKPDFSYKYTQGAFSA